MQLNAIMQKGVKQVEAVKEQSASVTVRNNSLKSRNLRGCEGVYSANDSRLTDQSF